MALINRQYEDLLKDVLDNGVEKTDRTGVGTLSVFGRQLRYDLANEGFPRITTKFVAMKAIDPEASATVPLVICGVVALVVPLVFYPFARTIWAALHLASSPIEPQEVDAAAAFLRGDPVPAPSLSTGSIGPRGRRAADRGDLAGPTPGS